MIEVKKMCKHYGTKEVFCFADISMPDKSICGLVGVNGAGKSTLLRILSGVIDADGGSVEIDGRSVYNNLAVKKDIFFLADDPYYDFGMTPAKLASFYKAFYDFDDNKFDGIISHFSLDKKQPLRNFSKGMRRQTAIAAALACKPKYLLLDEAFDGLDPLARMTFKRELIELWESGTTVIIASHSLRELEDICDSFILIDRATVKVCGKIADALDNIFKFQMAFDKPIAQSELGFEVIRFDTVGRVVTVVAHGDKEEIEKKIEALNPLVVDEIPMDFEDMFIEEVGDKTVSGGEK